jgi:hypothetical protein
MGARRGVLHDVSKCKKKDAESKATNDTFSRRRQGREEHDTSRKTHHDGGEKQCENDE